MDHDCTTCHGCGVSFDFRAVQEFGQLRSEMQVNGWEFRIGITAVFLIGEPMEDDGEGIELLQGLIYDFSGISGEVKLISPDGGVWTVKTTKVAVIEP